MKKLFYLALFFTLTILKAQSYSGVVFMKDNADVYMNQVYVTNLKTQHTVLSDYIGEFTIAAQPGDVIRFTSIISERYDLKVTSSMLGKQNIILLKPLYRQIEEVVIKIKPTGILKADVLALKSAERNMEIAQRVGLPEPKGDGYSPQLPMAAFQGGGLAFSVDAIYAAISGDKARQERLKRYEIMSANIKNIKNYFGTDYFTKLKIPTRLIDNFLQFVYTSDNLLPYLAENNFEATKPYLEKYLPIYLKRLDNSQLGQIIN